MNISHLVIYDNGASLTWINVQINCLRKVNVCFTEIVVGSNVSDLKIDDHMKTSGQENPKILFVNILYILD